MSNLKNKVQVTEVINDNTGELIDSSSKIISYAQEPPFVKLYFEDMLMLKEISGPGTKTIHALLPKMNYDNEIVVTGQMKEQLAKKMQMAKNTFEHSMGELVKKGILLKKGNNWYMVNPNLYGRGSWKDIYKLRMTITYSKEGKLIQVQPDFQKEINFENTDK